jgi:hypothetical protein
MVIGDRLHGHERLSSLLDSDPTTSGLLVSTLISPSDVQPALGRPDRRREDRVELRIAGDRFFRG